MITPRHPRLFALVVALVCSLGWAAPGHAAVCNHGSSRWTPAESRCAIRHVFPRRTRGVALRAQALRVSKCESTWDTYNVTRPYYVKGLFQFLDSTWWSTPYRRGNPFNPFTNSRAAYWLWRHDGGSWREWSCQP